MKILNILVLVTITLGAITSSLNAKSALEIIPAELINASGETVANNLEGKYVGIYFSAHWCPPCRVFTPELVKFRNAVKGEFEIVFVSADKSAKKQLGYMQAMNMEWVAIPWKTDAANELIKKFDIKGIPTLVIISPDGEVVTMSGKTDVEAKGEEALTVWKSANKST